MIEKIKHSKIKQIKKDFNKIKYNKIGNMEGRQSQRRMHDGLPERRSFRGELSQR